jgi:hypothetical protein
MAERSRSRQSGPRWWRRLKRSYRHGDGAFWIEVAVAIAFVAAVSLIALSLF